MSDFDQLRDDLVRIRQEIERLRQEQVKVRESVGRTERALTKLRSAGAKGEKERGRLKEKKQTAETQASQIKEQLAARLTEERALLEEVLAFSDPREGLGRWPERYPILLFPLRLETRFKQGERGQPQLWERVYPDTCLIDAVEGSLTEREVENAQAFWAAVWRAGGGRSGERRVGEEGRSRWVSYYLKKKKQ